MTNVHPLHNSTPEQRIIDAATQRSHNGLKSVSLGQAYLRTGWLEYGAGLNEIRAIHPGKQNDGAFGAAVAEAGLDKRPSEGGSPAKGDPIKADVRSAAMWAASLTPEELAGYEAKYPDKKVTEDSGFRWLHEAVKAEAKAAKAPKPVKAPTKADAIVDRVQGMMESDEPVVLKEVAKEFGTSEQPVKVAVARAQGRIETKEEFNKNPPIDISSVQGTMKEKLDRVLDQELKRLQREYSAEVQKLKDAAAKELEDERNRLIDELANTYKPLGNRVRELEAARKGIMTESEYKKILMCLHPDRREAVSPEELSEAFRIFKSKNIRLLPNEVTATTSTPLPDTWAELEKRRMRK